MTLAIEQRVKVDPAASWEAAQRRLPPEWREAQERARLEVQAQAGAGVSERAADLARRMKSHPAAVERELDRAGYGDLLVWRDTVREARENGTWSDLTASWLAVFSPSQIEGSWPLGLRLLWDRHAGEWVLAVRPWVCITPAATAYATAAEAVAACGEPNDLPF
jgi:hypothetical protein